MGNNTYIALLTFVPFFGFIWMFVLGAKGSAWAWRNGRWDSVEHFKRVQRKWAIWGAVIWIGMLVLFGGAMGGVFYGFRHSVPYEMSVANLQANPIAMNILGSPISTGFPFGNISINGASGKADSVFRRAARKRQALFWSRRSRKTDSGRSRGSRSSSMTAVT